MKAETPRIQRYGRVMVVMVVLTTAVSLPRFAHHTPDSQFYLDLANYFRGELIREGLSAPYAYRLLLPYLAALLPTTLSFNFALINLLCTFGTYAIFYFYLVDLLSSRREAQVGLLLLVVSFPTFNYVTGVLTDPMGLLFYVGATYLIVRQRPFLFSLVATVGVLAREAVLVVVLALMIHVTLGFLLRLKERLPLAALLAAVPPILVFFGVRQAFSDLPTYIWVPTVESVLLNLTSPISWATLLLTLLPLLVLLGLGLIHFRGAFLAELRTRFASDHLLLLFSATVACLALLAYSVLAAFMSGRFAWTLYTVLIPVAVVMSRDSRLYQAVLLPAAAWLFGSGFSSRN